MERTQAVIVAAEYLHASENAIDSAYAQVADLAGRLVRLRGEARLSSTVGQDAVHEVTAALSALGDAQAAIARAHAKLNVTKTRIGCRTVDTGGQDKDNQDVVPTQALKAVA
jgi:CelD/BcsL family acetyltransferase involved in cellulose biosynthesis